jgi:2-dehydropantoate 2-reductase
VESLVIAGAGALGSVYGGLLAAAGVEVVMLAHGRHEEALRRGELEIRLPAGTHRVRVRVADRAHGDALIVTSRLFDTDAALDRVDGAPMLAISLQNGLRKNEALVQRFGAECVTPATSMLAQGATTRRTSLLQAADAGRRAELDGIHGELVRRGAALGVPLPTVEACLRLARLSGVAS